MRFGHFLIGCASFITLAASGALADERQLCIRGKSFEQGREFLQTRQLRVEMDGPPADDLLLMLVGRAVRERLWPDLKSEEVHVAAYDDALCGLEPTARLLVHYGPEELEAIRLERGRGPTDQPHLKDVARRATGFPAPPKGIQTGAGGVRHDWLQVYFATTRQPTGGAKAAEAYGAEQGDTLRFGALDVSIPADHRWAKLESPSLLRFEWDVDPQRHVVLGDAFQTLSLADWKAELSRRAGAFDKGGVLLFVHGYNTTFAEAAQRAGQLAYDLSFSGPTVLFSWPSDGEVLAYTRDEEKARIVWRQMADVLDGLTRLGPDVPVYVIAHSMGNRVLTQGLAELLRRRPGADRAFRQVVLASPDIGEEEFRQRWIFELKSAHPPRFTLYASRQDVPITLSAWLHGEKRLGSGGSDIVVLPPLDSIDASSITREWFGLSHSYFGDNSTVMSDLFLVINQGVAPDKRPRLAKVKGSRGEYWEFKQ